MGEDETRRLRVTLWNASGTAVSRPPDLASIELRLDQELALPDVIARVEDVIGGRVALLHLGNEQVDVECLEPAEHLEWALPNAADRAVLRTSTPWYQPGWYERTTAALTVILREQEGATPTAPFIQQKHWSIGALLSVETDRGTYWAKQVPLFMAHEGPLTRWLGKRRPSAVPDMVATGEGWWLARAFPAPHDEPSTASPYGLLAEMQIEIASSTGTAALLDELRDLGCPDRSLASLPDELASLADRGDLLDDAPRRHLAAAGPAIAARVSDLLDAMPSWASTSLVHGDLHAGNWTRRPAAVDGGWLIFDWTDGAVAHPFVDLGVLPRKRVDLRDAWLGDYLGPWREAVGDTCATRAWTVAEPIAYAFHALSYQRIIDGLGATNTAEWRGAVEGFLGRMHEALSPPGDPPA